MSKVALVAKLNVQPGKSDEVDAALATLMEATEEEAGLEIYAAHRDANNPDVIWFYELYTDGDALAVHGQGEQMKAAMGGLGGLLAGAPEITMVNPLVAKGLEL